MRAAAQRQGLNCPRARQQTLHSPIHRRLAAPLDGAARTRHFPAIRTHAVLLN